MPIINGRYYMNPFYGRALEAAREAEERQRGEVEAEEKAVAEQKAADQDEVGSERGDFWADAR